MRWRPPTLPAEWLLPASFVPVVVTELGAPAAVEGASPRGVASYSFCLNHTTARSRPRRLGRGALTLGIARFAAPGPTSDVSGLDDAARAAGGSASGAAPAGVSARRSAGAGHGRGTVLRFSLRRRRQSGEQRARALKGNVLPKDRRWTCKPGDKSAQCGFGGAAPTPARDTHTSGAVPCRRNVRLGRAQARNEDQGCGGTCSDDVREPQGGGAAARLPAARSHPLSERMRTQ